MNLEVLLEPNMKEGQIKKIDFSNLTQNLLVKKKQFILVGYLALRECMNDMKVSRIKITIHKHTKHLIKRINSLLEIIYTHYQLLLTKLDCLLPLVLLLRLIIRF